MGVYILLRKENTMLFLSLFAFFIILANLQVIESPIVGTIASLLYLTIVGFLLGKVFLINEDQVFVKFIFGVFLLFCILIFIGVFVVILYKLNFLGLGVILSIPLSTVSILQKMQKINREKSEKARNLNIVSHVSPLFILFILLIIYCFFLLISSRSGWVYGTVWDVLPISFLFAYFIATFVLVYIMLISRTKTIAKVSLVVLYALLSVSLIAIVLYPDNYGDQSEHLGLARIIFDYGSLRRAYVGSVSSLWFLYWSIKEKGLALFTAIVAKMLSLDVYWVHTFITPVLWGIFIPVIAYRTTKISIGKDRISVLAAFLTAFPSIFIQWGSRSTANSLSLVFFFFSLYLQLKYLRSNGKRITLLIALLAAIATLILHRLPGLMALLFLYLAVTLRMYKSLRVRHCVRAYALLVISLLTSVLVIPVMFFLNTAIYFYFAPQYASEASTAFNFQNLVETPIIELIFGQYVDLSLEDLIIQGAIPFLGFIGLAYSFKKTKRSRMDEKNMLVFFMLLAFIVCIVNYVIWQYAMVNVLFSPIRIWAIRDLIAVPFAAVTLSAIVKFFEIGSKKTSSSTSLIKRFTGQISIKEILAVALIGLSLAALSTTSLYEGYEWFKGMHLTQLEVDAVKYIDANTNEKYIVITDPNTAMVGVSFVGTRNPTKYYIASRELTTNPSLTEMIRYMKLFKAGVGYIILPSFRIPDFGRAVAESSRIFGLFTTLINEKGKIYIFHYRIPPLPKGPDITAFYWDTPPSYFIQNDLVRAVFNPETKSLDLVDFWGDLYESLNLNMTLVNGNFLGDWTSIEYYDSSNDTWITWNKGENISSFSITNAQFKFRLNFERASLIGMLERNNPNLLFWWEGVQTSTLDLKLGDFSRLYIPGLIGEGGSYSVYSREFGFFYTFSRTENVLLHPAYRNVINGSSLTSDLVANYCNLTITKGYATYDFYVSNNASIGQWAYIEIWLPDNVYTGIYPPIHYSLDGKTWSEALGYSRQPIKTYNGTEVNWVITKPREISEAPVRWNYVTRAEGGFPTLPEEFTDSGGEQNRLLFGLYLPAHDRVLLRLGASIYYMHPLKITYVFKDSDDVFYGLRNMKEGLIKYYNHGTSTYIGGLELTTMPTELDITQDETGKIKSLSITLSGDAILLLLSGKNVNTTVDADENGIPDSIEG